MFQFVEMQIDFKNDSLILIEQLAKMCKCICEMYTIIVVAETILFDIITCNDTNGLEI